MRLELVQRQQEERNSVQQNKPDEENQQNQVDGELQQDQLDGILGGDPVPEAGQVSETQ